MLVEINLLPKKEPRNITPYLIIVSTVLIVTIIGIVMYSKVMDEKKRIADVKAETQQVKLQQITEEKKIKDKSNGNATEQLRKIVEETEKKTLHSVDLMNRIVSLLPTKGYFKSYKYEDGKITLHVLYKEYAEAAYYYKRLQDEEWVFSIKMSSIEEIEIGSETKEVFYNGVYEVQINKEKLKGLQKEGEV
jgi:type IV pilus assembly protein PilN